MLGDIGFKSLPLLSPRSQVSDTRDNRLNLTPRLPEHNIAHDTYVRLFSHNGSATDKNEGAHVALI
jgi:hypothetical protein